jgi:hypothetical protein
MKSQMVQKISSKNIHTPKKSKFAPKHNEDCKAPKKSRFERSGEDLEGQKTPSKKRCKRQQREEEMEEASAFGKRRIEEDEIMFKKMQQDCKEEGESYLERCDVLDLA